MRAAVVQVAVAAVFMLAGAWLVGWWMVGIVLMCFGAVAAADAVLRDRDRDGDIARRVGSRHEEILERWRRAP